MTLIEKKNEKRDDQRSSPSKRFRTRGRLCPGCARRGRAASALSSPAAERRGPALRADLQPRLSAAQSNSSHRSPPRRLPGWFAHDSTVPSAEGEVPRAIARPPKSACSPGRAGGGLALGAPRQALHRCLWVGGFGSSPQAARSTKTQRVRLDARTVVDQR